jgi:hypothetical protein
MIRRKKYLVVMVKRNLIRTAEKENPKASPATTGTQINSLVKLA